jgi:hypothetical protein
LPPTTAAIWCEHNGIDRKSAVGGERPQEPGPDPEADVLPPGGVGAESGQRFEDEPERQRPDHVDHERRDRPLPGRLLNQHTEPVPGGGTEHPADGDGGDRSRAHM